MANEVTMPISLFQIPMFDRNFPYYLNYGTVGEQLARQMARAFDDIGTRYGANGKPMSMWTSNAFNAFQSKSQCLVEQYNDFSYPTSSGQSLFVNGSQSLQDNLLDHNALARAWEAWRLHFPLDDPQKQGNKVLPGFENYTPEQMFFISFGQNLCENDKVFFF